VKKGLTAVVLTAILTRVLLQSGMQDSLGARIREAVADGSLLSASISLELGPPQETAPATETPAPTETGFPLSLMLGNDRRDGEEAETGAIETPSEVKDENTENADVLATTISGGLRINNKTELNIDIEKLMAEDLLLNLPAGSPQVLIIHTHSTEAYTPVDGEDYTASDPYRTTDPEHSVVKVGDILAEELEAQGLSVLHDRGLYDYPSYTGSYSRSGAAVESYLSEHPGIPVVIDLHRDALGDGDTVYKTMAEVEGETAAQIMLLVGTGEGGLEQPHWEKNLKLALFIQNAVNQMYPTLARPVAVVPERYNQQLTDGSLLLEVGSSGNSLSEAICAVRLFAKAVGPLLLSLVEK
jgi:stage II sporulation protein P